MKNNDRNLEDTYGVILAGGTGTRLWPLSRSLLPKQLLPLHHSESLFQQTARRLLKLFPPTRVLTVTQSDHEFEVKRQLRDVHPELTRNTLVEPEGRNTLPAIAWAVETISQRTPNALIGVFPSDHLIRNEAAFLSALDQAVEIASDGYFVTFGIQPNNPATGYGYIKAGKAYPRGQAYLIDSFVEKPDKETAVSYLKKGNHYWNAGIFTFSAPLFQKELQRLHPALAALVRQLPKGTERSEASTDNDLIYAQLPNLSMDYGLMEKVTDAAVIPTEMGWSDLGSWDALYEVTEKDEHHNATQGDVITLDTHNSLLISQKGLLTTIGLKDVVVIQTGDAILVSARDRVQEVRKIVERLRENHHPVVNAHPKVTRPWGTYTVLEEGAGYKIKRIEIHPGQKLSLQRHQHRAEHWVVVQGEAKVINGDQELLLTENQSTYIPQGHKHRLENPTPELLQVIEVQTGTYLGEDDIERFDDLYGRRVIS